MKACVVTSVLTAVLCAPALTFADLLLDGAEFQVNSFTTDLQYAMPGRSVARAADGGFVVAWTSYGQDGSDNGVFGQRYDSNGVPAGPEFQINTHTTGVQMWASVSAAPDGSFVVVWNSDSQDGSSRSVHGQRYDDSGAAVGSEFQVNTYTTGDQYLAVVSVAPDGSFVVVWESDGVDGSGESIQGQRYDSSGVAIGGEFQVNTYTTNDQRLAIVSNTASGFVVAWTSYGQDGSDTGVFGQRYDSAGTPVGTEFQTNTYTTSAQLMPAIAVSPDGSFVVVWECDGGQDGSGASVQGQRYDTSGAPAGTEFQVNTYVTSSQQYPGVSAALDGSFLVVWGSAGQDGSSSGVFGQRYDSSGAPAGIEFQVNTYTTGLQGLSTAVAADADGDFVVVWTGAGDGDDQGMFGQRLCADLDADTVCDSAELCALTGPIPGCITGAKASLQVKDDDDEKDQIKWKLSNGGALEQMDLGDPSTSRTYALCIYDESASSPNLVAALEIAPSTKWETKDPKGFQYKDSAGTESGVIKASLRTGDAGKSKAQVGAKGLDIPMPVPVSMTQFFNQDTKVTVQLVNDETGLCWTSEFTSSIKNDGVQFKAKTP